MAGVRLSRLQGAQDLPRLGRARSRGLAPARRPSRRSSGSSSAQGRGGASPQLPGRAIRRASSPPTPLKLARRRPSASTITVRLAVHEVAMLQRHGPLVVEDRGQVAVGRRGSSPRPRPGSGTVAERQISCTAGRAEQDRLLPGGAALRIAHVVDLVEDDDGRVVQAVRRPCTSMLRSTSVVMTSRLASGFSTMSPVSRPARSPADQAALGRPFEQLAEVAQLLVRERLDRRGVERRGRPA